ncbi:hypothetical protein ACWC5I_46945, partial [Kitasatospora sp. NPDC001574]
MDDVVGGGAGEDREVVVAHRCPLLVPETGVEVAAGAVEGVGAGDRQVDGGAVDGGGDGRHARPAAGKFDPAGAPAAGGVVPGAGVDLAVLVDGEDVGGVVEVRAGDGREPVVADLAPGGSPGAGVVVGRGAVEGSVAAD